MKSFVIPAGQQSLLDFLAQLDPKKRYRVTVEDYKKSSMTTEELIARQANFGGCMEIDTGDTVHHEPTGENWIVAFVDGDVLSPLGWPETVAKLADCTLLKKATPEDRAMWQKDLLRLPTSYIRGRWARDHVDV